ncbi:MAG: shikimate dehydrogenase [Actinomycetota bacterium]
MRDLRLVLLGMPLGHSRSPLIHTAALTACGLSGEYTLREVDATGFAAACAEIASGTLFGANVTMPHKRAAHDACAQLDPDATRAGAVNTLVGRGGVLAGWNTDVVSLRRAIESMPGVGVLILGAGASAAAALVAAGSRDVTVAARRLDEAERLVEEIRPVSRVVPWATSMPGAVVVNATALGMSGEALPEGVLEEAAGLIDLPYGTIPTPAIRDAAVRGLPAVDGVSLLVAQAAESFEIWTGQAAPREIMEQAARASGRLKAP